MFSTKLAKLATISAVGALSLAPVSFAGTIDTHSVEVDIAGYDLTTDAGSEAVLKKLENAAKKACDDRSGPKSVAEWRMTQTCIDDAMATAIDSLAVERERQAAAKARPTG